LAVKTEVATRKTASVGRSAGGEEAERTKT
jgi:hypothetical protein